MWQPYGREKRAMCYASFALVRQLPELEDGLPEVGPGARGAAVVTEIRV